MNRSPRMQRTSFLPDLTLTSVVFEYYWIIEYNTKFNNLTLTSVVFELKKPPKFDIIFTDLTLTSVVFE